MKAILNIKKFIKTIDSIADIAYKKINDIMDQICNEKYYGFEPESDKDYYALEEVKYAILLIKQKVKEFKEKIENVK